MAKAQTKDHTDQFLRGLSFFSGLSESDIDAFHAASAIKDYPKGKSLLLQGDKAEKLFVILQGWVKLYRGTNEGEEAVVALFTRGDVFGEAAIFGGASYPYSAEAAEDARLVEIPAVALKDRTKTNPDIAEHIMNSISAKMFSLQAEIERRTLMDAPQRVGCLLLKLASGMVSKGGTFSFPYDKSLAAQSLGMQPETFSRALAQLKSVGVTAKGPEITIDSFSCLSAYCCGYCTAQFGGCAGSRIDAICVERACGPKKTSKEK